MESLLNKTAIRLTITLAFFMEMLDSTVLNTSLPQMALSLHQQPLQLKVALTSYLLSLGVFIPISGWVADRFGARNTFAWAIVIFTLGSLCCSLAHSLPFLVASRILQGMGGAMMSPVARLVILQVYSKKEMVNVMSKITSISLFAPIIGPVVGGAITTYLSWRWIFWINIPLGFIGIWAVWRFMPHIKNEMPRRFDWVGFFLLGAGFSLLLWGFQSVVGGGFGGWQYVELLLGIAALLGYVKHMHTAINPLISMEIFAQRVFRIALMGGFVSRLGLAMAFVLPLLFQLGYGHDALISGLMIAPMAMGSVVMKRLVKILLKRYGYRRVLLWNTLSLALMVLSFTLLTLGLPWWVSEGLIFIYGLCISLNFSSGNTLMYSEVEDRLKSQSTSVGSAMQQICISFSIALAAIVIEFSACTRDLTHAIPLPAFRIAFLIISAIIVLALPIFYCLKPQDGQSVSGHLEKLTGCD